jgi:hypothetical protein
VYGDANSALTEALTSGNLVNGNVLSGAASTVASATSDVGNYAIEQGTVSAGGNYALTFINGDLEVMQRPITVTAGSASRVYGDANSALTEALTSGNLVNGNVLSGTASTVATATANVGSYAIGQGTVSAGGNYTLTFNDGTLSIDARPVTVTAAGATKVYGNLDPGFTYSASSLGAGAPLAGSLARSAGSNVGSYAINQGSITDAVNPNYLISYVANDLTITPRPLTIGADDYVRDQGEANPLFAATAVGFASGDSLADLSGTLALSTVANTSSASGVYPITPSGLTSRNYTITYVDGVLTIRSATSAEQPSAAIAAAQHEYACDESASSACVNSRSLDTMPLPVWLHVTGGGMRLPAGLSADIATRTL